MWTDLADAVSQGFVDPDKVDGVTVWWIWCLSTFGTLTTGYWVWHTCRVRPLSLIWTSGRRRPPDGRPFKPRRRCPRSGGLARLPSGAWIVSFGAFATFAGMSSSQYWGYRYSLEQVRSSPLFQ